MNKKLPMLSQADKVRFWSYVIKKSEDECWPWIGPLNDKNRGYLKINAINYYSTRIAYLIEHEEDPGELLVCHACDNPPCHNPKHFFLGTYLDNNQDRDKKNRHIQGRISYGEDHGRAKLTLEEVKAIRFDASMLIPQSQIAKKYNISCATVCLIVNNKIWKE